MLLASTFQGINILISTDRLNTDEKDLYIYDALSYFDEEFGGYVLRVSDGFFDFDRFIEDNPVVEDYGYLEVSIISEIELEFNEESLVDFSYDAGIILDSLACGEIVTMDDVGFIERYDISEENLYYRANELEVEIFENTKEWIKKYSHKIKTITIKDVLEEKLLNSKDGQKIKDKTFLVEPVSFSTNDTTKIDHRFDMPNKNTFQIPNINKLLQEETKKGIWIDPFANSSNWGHVSNELNLDYNTDFHLDALEFLKGVKTNSIDGVIFDPPYSLEQIRRSYNKVGLSAKSIPFKSNRELIEYHNEVKREIARVLKVNGKAICFGWTLIGIGGITDDIQFFMNELRIIKHGGMHHDTIVTIEVKTDMSKNNNAAEKNVTATQMMFNFEEISSLMAISLFNTEQLSLNMIDRLSNHIITYNKFKNVYKEKSIVTFVEDSTKHPLFQSTIREILISEISDNGSIWIDPFCERTFQNYERLCQVTNSIYKNCGSDFHLDPHRFLKLFKNSSVNGVLFNPPSNPTESKEYYMNSVGSTVGTNCGNSKWWSNMKDEIARIVKIKGKVISFGNNSVGMGESRGFRTSTINIISFKDDYSLFIVIDERIK